MAKTPEDRILQRRVFERLLFAQCWEDPELDRQALEIRPHHTLLSVTSGGCNTLSLAVLEPRRIIAVDLNATQNYLLELKIAGARWLDHEEYLELLGVRPSRRRWGLYEWTRVTLSRGARCYWDTQRGAIEKGVLRAGRYERFLEVFRHLLQLLEGTRTIRRLFECSSLAEQRRFYEEAWDTRIWRLFFRVFFSRRIIGMGGLDPRFFTYVTGISSYGKHFAALAQHALTEIPIRDNYFIAQICLGRYLNEQAVPPYLRAENFETLKRAVDRIEIVTGELAAVLRNLEAASIDRFNFSNVFEWVPPETFTAMLRDTHRAARPGARLCYRNLLVDRRHPDELSDLFVADENLATRLLRQDRSFVYSRFEIASVLKAAAERKVS